MTIESILICAGVSLFLSILYSFVFKSFSVAIPLGIMLIITIFYTGISELHAMYKDKKQDKSINTLVMINENFQNSGRIVHSQKEAEKYKIIPEGIFSDPLIEKNVSFDFHGNVLFTRIKKNDSFLCYNTIVGLANIHKTGSMVNGKDIHEVTRSSSNIEYACDQAETIIENHID